MKNKKKGADAMSCTLTEKDISLLIKNAVDIRDRVMLELLIYTGCRRKELTLLRVKHLDFEHDRIYMPTVKRRDNPENHLRQIPILSQRMKQDILTYIELWKTKYDLCSEDRLIQQRSKTKKNGISTVRVNQIVSDIAVKANVLPQNPYRKHLNPHIFRHSFARIARRRGLNFKIIQQIMGHASIATTFDLYGLPDWVEIKEESLEKLGDFASDDGVNT